MPYLAQTYRESTQVLKMLMQKQHELVHDWSMARCKVYTVNCEGKHLTSNWFTIKV